ncbi:MAG: PepSY domain-containing protein [Alphaproteobacteria bacterium]|nr:PepSY domain-containing protein [Alphaproteobacteria bacterium]MBV9695103.1 PepSY domain-containing protein [Alphaproteobacteria bacterium]
MRMRAIACLCLAFGALWSGAAWADDDRNAPSLDSILPAIRQHHPGKFYDAEGPYEGPDGQLRYRLKWMTPDGRIVWFDADAHTGRVLSPEFEQRVRPPLREERPDLRPFERPRPPRRPR